MSGALNPNLNINAMFNGINGLFNRSNSNGNNVNTMGDYAFGDISTLISSLGINQNNGPPPASKEIVKDLKEFVFNE
eukprot:UN06793